MFWFRSGLLYSDLRNEKLNSLFCDAKCRDVYEDIN